MPSGILNDSLNKQDILKKQADDTQKVIESGFFDMSDDNRKSMAAEMLLNYYLYQTGRVLGLERKKRAAAQVNRILSKTPQR